MSYFHIGHQPLLLKDLSNLISNKPKLVLTEDTRSRIQANHDYLLSKLNHKEQVYYGINTGFGSFCTTRISSEDLKLLQANLIKSHAAGSGDYIPDYIVRIMLILKIQNLSLGYSGVRPTLVQLLIDLYNFDILPIIPSQGSLGASGDLAPLAHLSLALLGLGEVYYKNKRMPASKALELSGLQPIRLGPKEGLALINGTQFSTAFAVYACLQSEHLIQMANHTLSLSLEAFDGDAAPFDALIQDVRPHNGQRKVAQQVRQILKESACFKAGKKYVQDPYSFRCAPQVHGASWDTLNYVESVVQTEINAVSDNPILFKDEDKIISGGNFHAQPIALVLDFLSIAMAELASISERRCFKLLSGERGLKPNLATNPGLESGLMIAQYTAASIVSQNKQLCTPASVDSIVSSAGQEDHVSMAANAATKCHRVLDNVLTVLSIEFFTGAQALASRHPYKSSPVIEKLLLDYRKEVPVLHKDETLYDKFVQTRGFWTRLWG